MTGQTTVTANNRATGEVQPAIIGFTSSPVMMGIAISLLFKLLGLLALLSPRLGFLGQWQPDEKETAEIAGQLSIAVSSLADIFAFFKRKNSPLQPVTFGTPQREVVSAVLLLLIPGLLIACNQQSQAALGRPTNAQIGASVQTITQAVLSAAPSEVVASAQKYTQSCDFIPTIATVLNIGATLRGFNISNATDLGSHIGNAICTAVRAGPGAEVTTVASTGNAAVPEAFMSGKNTRKKDNTPTVNGVPVKGSPTR